MTVRDILTFVVKLMIACPIVYIFAIATINWYFAKKESFANQQFSKLMAIIASLKIRTTEKGAVTERSLHAEDPQQKQPV